jgi:hypothetical protein
MVPVVGSNNGFTTTTTPAVVEYDQNRQICNGQVCLEAGTQFLFARQPDGTIQYSMVDLPIEAPSGAPQLVPGGETTPSTPTAAQLGKNAIFLFTQGTNHVVRENKLTVASPPSSGSTWGTWGNVSTPAGPLLTANAPFVTSFDGALFLFVRDSNTGIVDVTTSTDGTNWSAVTEVPNKTTLSTPTAALFQGTLFVMIQAGDSTVWLNSFSGTPTSGNWNTWVQVVDVNGHAIPTSTSPAGGQDLDNNFHLIVRDPNGTVKESVLGTSWSAPTPVIQSMTTPSAPTATQVPGSAAFNVFIQSGSGNIWENDSTR